MAELLAPQTGVLIALMYPMDNHEGGPPFSVSLNDYVDALLPGFNLMATKECTSFAERMGKEQLAIFQRK